MSGTKEAKQSLMNLPILEHRQEILNAARPGGRIVLSSPPGSGKSTQVPQILIDGGKIRGRIAVLQPRRLAARMLAARVSAERETQLGGETGCRVKLEDRTSSKTRIIFETEGILLRELISDPLMKQYGCLIFDEFHERHIASDIALAAALDLQRKQRPDLLIIVMSATLELEKISEYMNPCETINAEGKTYPVQTRFCDSESARMPKWEAAAIAASMFTKQTTGHTLIFMPGAYEINKTIDEIRKKASLKDFLTMPLYGTMRNAAQDKAMEETARRKIIVATNIAETSLTINGTDLVIDSGLARVARYDAGRAVNTLFTERITRSSAEQRAGRAGRTCPGMCIRLWTETDNRSMPAAIEPEIMRLDLSEALLLLKGCGHKTFSDLKWLDLPDKKDIEKAESLLYALGAADKDGNITHTGRRMAAMPLPPRYARMAIEGERQGCPFEAAIIAAAAQGKTIWSGNAKRENEYHSDLWHCADAVIRAAENNFSWQACQHYGIDKAAASEAFETAKRICPVKANSGKRLSGVALAEALAKSFLPAFPDRIAASPNGGKRYLLPGGRRAGADPCSAAFGAAVIAAGEALEKSVSGGTDITLSFATEIRTEWLKQSFPDEIHTETVMALDPAMLTPIKKTNTYYRDVLIETRTEHCQSGKISSEVIAEEFISGRQKFKEWNEDTEDFLERVNFLHKHCPDFGIMPLSDEDLALVINDICDGATSVSAAKSRPVLPHIKDWYGYEACRLIDRHAPQRLQMPNGRKARIRYPKNGDPYLDAKIQDLFGIEETPRIAAGRVPLIIHILAPSMRPVQVTSDLKSFWSESYPKLKPALARRYPRHKW